MNTAHEPLLPLSRQELETIFHIKYGRAGDLGWGPRMRLLFGYFNPDDQYETLVAKLVNKNTRWLDVGCGRDLFPSNRALARQLSERCAFLMGVDPDETLDQNPFVHAKARVPIENFVTDRGFDLVTMRMVAEHIANPAQVVNTLAKAINPGGYLMIYTVNRFSPVPLVTNLVPFGLHHPVKRLLWQTEKQDTFPTCFRMNTRRTLHRLMETSGLMERGFAYLDDCRTFGRFRMLLFCELSVWWLLRKLGLRYPENCLLGIYQRTSS
jgi:SAM-dependent methyltransferase